MKKIGITKIEVNNPVISIYVKTINSWQTENVFVINDNYFYGIFLDDKFLGASTMEYNPETSNVDVLMLSGASEYSYDKFQEESEKKLMKIAFSQYREAKTVNVRNAKTKIKTQLV